MLAQERQAAPAPTCLNQTMGYLDGHVILWQRYTRATSGQVIDLCRCGTKHPSKPKHCVDVTGQIVNPPSTRNNPAAEAANKPAPDFQILAGKTNCRLVTPDEMVIKVSGNTIKVGKQCHCVKTSDCNCKGKPNCGCDCSCQGMERWNFKAVDDEDPSKGFYITTRERAERAIMRTGNGFTLRQLNTMDGKMRAMSQWNYFINDRAKDGSTQYMLRPQDSYDKVLATNSRNGSLTMVDHYFTLDEGMESNNNSPRPVAGRDQTSKPFVMMKDWKCECVF